MTILELFEQACNKLNTRILPDLSGQFGREFPSPHGYKLRLVAQNDLGIPYFVRVKNGRAGKTQYTCASIEADLIGENPLFVPDPFATAEPCWKGRA